MYVDAIFGEKDTNSLNSVSEVTGLSYIQLTSDSKSQLQFLEFHNGLGAIGTGAPISALLP